MKTTIKFITLLTILFYSCATTERTRIHTSKPRPVSGSYLVQKIKGNFAYCKGLYKPIFVSDTVQVGEYIMADIHFYENKKP